MPPPGMSAATSTTTTRACPACRRALGDGRHRLCQHAGEAVSSHAGDAISAAGRLLRATTNPLALKETLTTAVDTARHPVRLLDALTSVSSVDNEFSTPGARSGGSCSPSRPTRRLERTPRRREVRRLGREHPPGRSAIRGARPRWNAQRHPSPRSPRPDRLSHRAGRRDLHDLAWMMPISSSRSTARCRQARQPLRRRHA